jgi:hypothetical protein
MVIPVKLEDLTHSGCFFHLDEQTSRARDDIVAEHRRAAHPFPFAPRCRHLVAGSFSDQLSFILRKRE